MKVIYHRVKDGKTMEKLEVKEMEIMEYADGSLRLSLDFKQKYGHTGTSIPLIINKNKISPVTAEKSKDGEKCKE